MIILKERRKKRQRKGILVMFPLKMNPQNCQHHLVRILFTVCSIFKINFLLESSSRLAKTQFETEISIVNWNLNLKILAAILINNSNLNLSTSRHLLFHNNPTHSLIQIYQWEILIWRVAQNTEWINSVTHRKEWKHWKKCTEEIHINIPANI